MQACAGSHDDNRPAFALALQVMSSQCDGVDYAAEVDVQGVLVWLLQLAICVDLEVQVVGAGANSSIGEHVINPAMLVLCCFEEFCKAVPVPHIGLYEKEITSRWRVLDIAADDKCAEG
jgi:hypothetical protein